jgi:transposase-like protein
MHNLVLVSQPGELYLFRQKGKVVAPKARICCRSCDSIFAIDLWQWEECLLRCACSEKTGEASELVEKPSVVRESQKGGSAARRFDRLSGEQKKFLVEAYCNSTKMEVIYRKFNASRETLRKWLLWLGVDPACRPCPREARRKTDYPLSDAQITSIIEQWAAGVAQERIAASVGLNRPQLIFWRDKLNLPHRVPDKPKVILRH